MAKEFQVGDRVGVSKNYHWAKGQFATIAEPPAPVIRMVDGWQGPWRIVEAVRGPLKFYWVEFDEPQRDADGDGPYFGGEIDSECLELVK